VTLLAAMQEPDGCFVCISDRCNLVVDQNNAAAYRDGDKWTTVAGVPRLLWAWAGSDGVGLALASHIEDAASDWPTLRAAVAQNLRALCGKAGAAHMTDCLIVGWLGDVPGILHIRADDGTGTWKGDCPGHRDTFVGWGSLGAERAWKYATAHLGAERSRDNLAAPLKLIISEDALLDGFEMWDIPPDGSATQLSVVPTKASPCFSEAPDDFG